MRLEIDIVRFEQLAGHSRWLGAAAAAFLVQIPQWYQDFYIATSTQSIRDQWVLLHKIKGSCYAVGAYGLTELIQQAEAEKVLGKALTTQMLLSRLEQLGAELRAVCDSPAAP